MGEGSVSYRQLGTAARELAEQLRRHGVRPGDVVGVCLPRSAESVASAIAVLTVGMNTFTDAVARASLGVDRAVDSADVIDARADVPLEAVA